MFWAPQPKNQTIRNNLMLTYHINLMANGTSIQLMESAYCIILNYGMQQTVFNKLDMLKAANEAENCINHAMGI